MLGLIDPRRNWPALCLVAAVWCVACAVLALGCGTASAASTEVTGIEGYYDSNYPGPNCTATQDGGANGGPSQVTVDVTWTPAGTTGTAIFNADWGVYFYPVVKGVRVTAQTNEGLRSIKADTEGGSGGAAYTFDVATAYQYQLCGKWVGAAGLSVNIGTAMLGTYAPTMICNSCTVGVQGQAATCTGKTGDPCIVTEQDPVKIDGAGSTGVLAVHDAQAAASGGQSCPTVTTGTGSSCAVTLGADDSHRLDLAWWGVWAVVGLMFVGLIGATWRRSWGLGGKLGNG